MKYDFDQIIERRGTRCEKWDAPRQEYGREDLLPLWVADMDFPVARPIQEVIEKRAAHPVYGYTQIPDSVYQAVCHWLKTRHGWEVDPEWITFTTGVKNAFALAVSVFTNPGDKVIVQSPVYAPFFRAVEENGCRIVNNQLRLVDGRYEMDLDRFARQLDSRTRLMIFCSPHNPVGRVWTRDELRRLGELCCENDVVIVSDEVHSDFVYSGHKHIPLASISEEIARNTVTCIAPSKTFNLAGLATAAVIIPNPRLRSIFQSAVQSLGIKNGLFGVLALEAAYQYGADWLDQLLEYLEGNLQFVRDFVRERIPTIKLIEPEGTYLVWLDCSQLGLREQQLQQLLVEKAGVVLNDGAWFGPGGEGFQRLNIGCPRPLLRDGLIRIERAVNQS